MTETKITIKCDPADLQMLAEALSLWIEHIEDGQPIPIIGMDATACLMNARDLRDSLGIRRRSEPGEYPRQRTFLPPREGQEQ